METRANHLLVGGFVLLFAAGLFGFVIWLAKFQGEVELSTYKIVFEDSVSGLSVGNAVRYSGVRVGAVTEIKLDPDAPGKVVVLVELQDDVPIKRDTVASLELEGITGARYVLLSGGSSSAPVLTAEGDEIPEIPSQPSALAKVLEGAPEVIANINLLLTRANTLLGPENQRNFATVMQNMAGFTTTLAENKDEIGELMREASVTMSNLREMSATINTLAADLSARSQELADSAKGTLNSVENLAGTLDTAVQSGRRDVTDMLQEFQAAAASIREMSNQIQGMVAENREPLRDFTATGLYELANLLTEARQLITGLNRVTTEVERDPARFLFGDPQEGYEGTK
jgi:phospholipid/cholesterol/gamma-HCH transport system substrate-binding protein